MSRSPRARATSRSSISSATPPSAWRPIRARPPTSTAIAAMAALTGRTIDETGTTTYRPPFVPTPMGVIAGRRRGALRQSAAAPAARGRASGRRRADARIWRLAEARMVRAGRPRARDPARGRAGARRGRAVRRLLARQDRDHRPRRRRARRLPQLQPPLDAQARQDPLRLRVAGIGHRARRRGDAAARRRSLSRLLLLGAHGCGAHAARTLATGSLRCPPRRHSRHDRAMGDAHRHRPALARSHRGLRARRRARRSRACRTWPSRPARSTAARSGSRG